MKPEILDLSNDDPMVQRAMVRFYVRLAQVNAASARRRLPRSGERDPRGDGGR